MQECRRPGGMTPPLACFPLHTNYYKANSDYSICS